MEQGFWGGSIKNEVLSNSKVKGIHENVLYGVLCVKYSSLDAGYVVLRISMKAVIWLFGRHPIRLKV